VEAAALSTLKLTEGTGHCASKGWQGFGSEAFADEAACRNHFQAIYQGRLTDFVDR
jgi:hypothetical protein